MTDNTASPVPNDLPNLGLATTAQLLDELRARIEIDYFAGGGGLGYTTVGGRPESSITTQDNTDDPS